MKIVIFGATGRTGIPLVKQALQAGHEVVGFVRNADKMPVHHTELTLVQGDAMNAADVQKAITPDVDAVINTLAPVKGVPATMLPTAADNIIRAMEQSNVKRLIYMTGAGVSMPEDKPGLFDKFIKFALKTLAGDVLDKSVEGVEKVQHSSLDWTVVRAPMLTNGEHTGEYRVGMVGVNSGPRISRADAADFMLKEIKDAEYMHQAPVVSY